MITSIAGAFGGVSGGGGESGSIFSGVNSALGVFGLWGNRGDAAPAAYLNYILFDQNYKVLNMGWALVPTAAYFSRQLISIPTVNVKEAGYIFVYISYEDQSNNYVEFDDLKITHTKTNVIQNSDYYPFGMQTNSSWTRENSTNNYLYDAGNELNASSGWYETFFRGYDPALGRMHQVDPYAPSFGSVSPYNYSLNNPIAYNDPNGGYPKAIAYVPRFTETDYGGHDWGEAAGIDGKVYIPFKYSEFIQSANKAAEKDMDENRVKDGSMSVAEFQSKYAMVGSWEETYMTWYDADGNYMGYNLSGRYIFTPEDEASQGGDYPGHDGGTLAQFSAVYNGCTLQEVQNELDSKGNFNSQPGGPAHVRYVEDPLNKGKYIDMRHMLVVGYKWGELVGLGVEIWQLGAWPKSAMNAQDFYSNHLGDRFEQIFGNDTIFGGGSNSQSPSFINDLNTFLNSNYYREDWSRVVK